MQAVRRFSMPFVQPVTRLFRHDNTSPPEALTTQDDSEVTTTEPLTQVVSDPVRSVSLTDADLPLVVQDRLYLYQLTQPKAIKLSPVAFRAADIVWRIKDSENVYNVLKKKGMITPEGDVRTANISNKFAHQLPFLTGFGQRRVIGLLFWWEEEVQRLKQLFAQLYDIDEALKRAQEGQDRAMIALLKVELERTRMLIKQKPSERHSDEPPSETQEPLPAYSPRVRNRNRERNSEQPPMYAEDPRTFVAG